MKKREKIILVVMALVVLYGALDFLVFSKKSAEPPPEAQADPAELAAFTRTVTESMKQSGYTEAHFQTIAQAAAPWKNNPFLDSVSEILPEPEDGSTTEEAPFTLPSDVSFSYTGFLSLGAVRMAIINGSEYQEGDQLETAGFFVKSISAQEVVIGVTGRDKNIILPLVEPNLPPTKPVG